MFDGWLAQETSIDRLRYLDVTTSLPKWQPPTTKWLCWQRASTTSIDMMDFHESLALSTASRLYIKDMQRTCSNVPIRFPFKIHILTISSDSCFLIYKAGCKAPERQGCSPIHPLWLLRTKRLHNPLETQSLSCNSHKSLLFKCRSDTCQIRSFGATRDVEQVKSHRLQFKSKSIRIVHL
ncbi:putative transcriptional regulatory protein [Fusarium oxysporum f. sp. albedinis]|nr:putative transcriptional regulatory protein [Fusarium oxysporum f. sp. albedinis]